MMALAKTLPSQLSKIAGGHLFKDTLKALVIAGVIVTILLYSAASLAPDENNRDINATASINLDAAPIKQAQSSLVWSDFTKNERGLNLPIINSKGTVFDNFKAPLPDIMAPEIKHRTSVIVTNLGYDLQNTTRYLKDLPSNYAIAINPYAPYATNVLALAQQGNHELWLHVPAKIKDQPYQEAIKAIDYKVPAPDNLAILADVMGKVDHYVGVYISKDSNILTSANDMDPLMSELARRGLGLITANETQSLSTLQTAEQVKLPLVSSATTLDVLPLLPNIVKQLDGALENGSTRQELLIVLPKPNLKLLKETQNWLTLRMGKNTNFVPPSALIIN